MTNKRGEKDFSAVIQGFHVEAERSKNGIDLEVCGVVGINEFNGDEICLKTHSGRILVKGSGLEINLLENKSIEISGKIEEICFKYGKA